MMRPRLTIARLMILVAAVGLLMAYARAVGIIWLAVRLPALLVGWVVWVVCRDRPDIGQRIFWWTYLAIAIVAVAPPVMIYRQIVPFHSAIIATFAVVLLFPVILAAGIRWTTFALSSNRVSIEQLILAYSIGGISAIVAAMGWLSRFPG